MKKKCITLALLALFTTSLAACTTKVADDNKNDNDKSSDVIDGEPTDAGEGDGEGQGQGSEGQGQGGDSQTEKVNVTFNANNGSANTTIQVNKGGKVTAPSAPAKDSDTYYSYTFTGWYRDQGLTQQFSFVNDVVNSDIVLYAGWKQSSMKYTITYMYNNNKLKDEAIEAGKKVTYVPEDDANYSFLSWYTDPNLSKEFNVDTPITSSFTLYAKYVETSSLNSNIKVSDYKGYTEGIYVEFDKIAGLANTDYKISYKSNDMTDFVQINSNLVRIGTNVRADIVGLKEGKYSIRIDANADFKIINNINVTKDDRSGYAHFGSTAGVGAYNDDGTLKSNADVIYVTNDNKNTVTATINNKTYTGLVSILQAQSKSSTPLDIRIIGEIKTNQWNSKSNEPRLTNNSNLQEDTFFDNTFETKYGDNLAGLTVQYMDKYSKVGTKYITTAEGLEFKSNPSTSSKTTTYKGSEYPDLYGSTVYDDDSYFNMLDISGASNVTVEGIGSDATIFQWGFTWSKCNSIEVKNLTFTDYTEDACSFDGSSNPNTNSRFWIHNNTFNKGKNNWDISGERDKYAGDGAMDLKYVSKVTSSYNTFYKCKKTGLVGGGDSDLTKDITFHHNFYNEVGSRLPLGRQANMHIYNNYYYSCGTCQDLRANAFVLSESNYFYGCTNAKLTQSGAVIKAYNDVLVSCSKDQSTTVSSRDTELEGSCKPDGSTDYTNFDTNSSLFYYDSKNKKSNVMIMNSTDELRALIPSVAGAGAFANLTFDESSNGGNENPSEPEEPTETQTLLNEEFSSSITPTKTSGIPTSAGLFYSITNDKDANTYNYVKVENGAVTVYDNSSKTSSDTDDGTSTTTYAYYIFNDTCQLTTGKVTYSVDLILSSQNSKWTMLQFIDENGLSLGIRSNDSTILGYTLGGETVTTMFSSKYSTGTYTIKLVIDYDNDTCQLSINNSTVNISYTPSTIKGLYFMTSAGSARTYKFDNIKVEVE